MNNDVELDGRPRPLSTGLWTLFSWLRRDDRSDSSESLSSAGSDRTVASFAFLTPAHYRTEANPIVLPPPGPPTDSYKKRVHDRNLRRQYDRDITLHRKYGLIKSGETSCGYDALSLPPVRRIIGESGSRRDRDRRATSECFQRRLAHVPGKRRAPLPPVVTIPSAPSSSLNRRSTRKRRAPQPPIKITEYNKENLKNLEGEKFITQMNPHSNDKRQKIRNNDVTMHCKSEKYSTKEGRLGSEKSKDTKLKPEKSFLKQIFDSKKRNSGVDISSVKLLPSISELDKQAAEIIEKCKVNASEKNNNIKSEIRDKIDIRSPSQSDTWICVGCLRKYNKSIVTCLYCLPTQKVNLSEQANDKSTTSKASSSYTQTENNLSNLESAIKNTNEEKQKLKEMLKEMKDSLPKRPKHVNEKLEVKTSFSIPSASEKSSVSTETPTLRVGCTMEPSTSHNIVESQLKVGTSANRSSPVTPIDHKSDHNSESFVKKDVKKSNEIVKPVTNIEKIKVTKSVLVTAIPQSSDQIKRKIDLHTPLRISSLLNPVYVPKNSLSNKPQDTPIRNAITFNKPAITSQQTCNPTMSFVTSPGPSTSQSRLPITIHKDETKPINEGKKKDVEPNVLSQSGYIPTVLKKDTTADLNHNNKISNPSGVTSSKENNLSSNKAINPDQHTRRRDLIHQLEQSIAKGDELAAAEAASKLAQLRLSCSVLSFSSQILSQPSTSKANIDLKGNTDKEPPEIFANETTSNDTKQFQNIAQNKLTPSSVSNQINVTTISNSVTSSSVKETSKKENSVTQKTIPEAKKNDATPNDTMTT